MRRTLDWVRRNVRPSTTQVLTLFTPTVARHQSALVRGAIAGATLAGLLGAAAIGVVGIAALMFALAAIYFLSTQVLGLRFDVDPAALYQTVQRSAAAAYGAN